MQKVLSTLALGTVLGVSIFGVVACGRATQNTPSGTPAQQTSQTPPPQRADSTEAIIGELLSNLDEKKSSPSAAPNPSPSPVTAPAPEARVQTTSATPSSVPSVVAGDSWASGVNEVKGRVPTWDNGSGVVIKFLKESTGERLSLIYVDPTPPVMHTASGHWIIQAKAMSDGKPVGHVLLALKDLAPGRYEGAPDKQDVILAAQMAESWDGKNPETTWSTNTGSWCEITLRQGKNPGDLEGDFRGKLVDNSGSGYHTIEAGYIYINR